jgi:small subunit ribosomal protein S3
VGQKVNPNGMRLGIIRDWESVWYSGSNCAKYILEDYKIRKFIKQKIYLAGIAKVMIMRTSDRIKVIVFAAKPGLVIGRNGQYINELSSGVQNITEQKVSLSVEEIRHPEMDAQLSAEDIAKQLENRVTFRRAMRQVMNRARKSGAQGIKTSVSGRLGGTDIARTEHYHEGKIPMQTLRANVEYGFAEANTTYGKIGVKVWLYKGEILKDKRKGD